MSDLSQGHVLFELSHLRIGLRIYFDKLHHIYIEAKICKVLNCTRNVSLGKCWHAIVTSPWESLYAPCLPGKLYISVPGAFMYAPGTSLWENPDFRTKVFTFLQRAAASWGLQTKSQRNSEPKSVSAKIKTEPQKLKWGSPIPRISPEND